MKAVKKSYSSDDIRLQGNSRNTPRCKPDVSRKPLHVSVTSNDSSDELYDDIVIHRIQNASLYKPNAPKRPPGLSHHPEMKKLDEIEEIYDLEQEVLTPEIDSTSRQDGTNIPYDEEVKPYATLPYKDAGYEDDGYEDLSQVKLDVLELSEKMRHRTVRVDSKRRKATNKTTELKLSKKTSIQLFTQELDKALNSSQTNHANLGKTANETIPQSQNSFSSEEERYKDGLNVDNSSKIASEMNQKHLTEAVSEQLPPQYGVPRHRTNVIIESDSWANKRRSLKKTKTF